MDEEKKAGYVAAGIFSVASLIIITHSISNGLNGGYTTPSIGVVLALIGIGSFWKPKTIGGVAMEYLNRINGKEQTQLQKNTKDSIQALAKDNSKIRIGDNYYGPKLPRKKKLSEKKQLIKEINSELSKEKLSNLLIKCIRLAKIVNSEKDICWLENEAYGYKRDKDTVKRKDVPEYRIINTELRLGSTASRGYTPLNYPLLYGRPIFEIEDNIEEYKPGAGELILWSTPSEDFKKIYKSSFKKEMPHGDMPLIISVSELKKILNGLKLKISDFINSIK